MQKEFKLEKVLEFRERKLEEEKMKLITLNNAEQRLVERMREIQQDIKQKQQQRLDEANAGVLSMADMYVKYVDVKEHEGRQFQQKREEILKLIANQKVVVNQALSDVKVIQKLKEKHLLAYYEFVKKQEELQNDEINVMKRKLEDL